MKIKKPSLKGMKNCGYLGHFAQDKYMEQGHNYSGTPKLTDEEEKKRQEYLNAPMAWDIAEKKRRAEKKWREEIQPENKRIMEKNKAELAAEEAEKERRYGMEADLRLVRRQAIKRRMKYGK